MPKLKNKSENQKRISSQEATNKYRANEVIRDKLREIDRKSKAIRRQNNEIRLSEIGINKRCQKKRLSNPHQAFKHRQRLRVSQEKRLRDPLKKIIHLEREKAHQKQRLSDPEKRQEHRDREKACRSARLNDLEKRQVRRERQKACQAARLTDPNVREVHRDRLNICQTARLSDIKKRLIHCERLKISQAKIYKDPNKLKKHRKNMKIIQKKKLNCLKNRLKHNVNVLERYHLRQFKMKQSKKMALIKSYVKDIKDGPFWKCVSCNRLWFRNSVKHLTMDNFLNTKVSFKFIAQCCPDMLNDKEIGLLCTSCRRDISNCKIPKLSLYYKELMFPEIPPVLTVLTQLEERFLAPRIPFMQICSVGGNQQFSVRGRVVNVPTDVQESIQILPRLPHETDVVAVALKKKTTFRSNYLFETVRPNVIFNALQFLKNCPVYQEAGVMVDDNRLHGSPFVITEKHDEEDDDNDVSEISDSEGDVDPQPVNIPDNETFLLSDAIVFAPGECFKPLPLFLDIHAESMSFIKLYGGHLRTIPKHLSYQNWVKSEIMRSDRRCALVSKLFYSSLKLRARKIASSIGFCLRKRKGISRINVQQALSDEFTNHLALCDSGYKVFSPDRGSPAFWEQKKKEVFAMIRQLGPPTFFITLSPAETKWPELLLILKKLIDKEDLSDAEVLEMSYEEKVRLIKLDPVTCARYFDYRMRKLFSLIKSKETFFKTNPVVDSYLRVEFQQRGSPHIHGLLWLENTPRYKEGDDNNNKFCAKFIDRFVTCSSEGMPEELIQFQRHKHTFTCKKITRRGKMCRFGIPYFPMSRTIILEPLNDNVLPDQRLKYKNNIYHIKRKLEILYRKGTDINFEQFLNEISMTENEYIISIRSTLQRPTTFLKRSPPDIRINCYNREILELHRANMDLQFITDTWSCAMYVLNYINKSKRGISRLLQMAIEEVKTGNYSIREKLRHVANKFLNASEFSAQEAVYYILSMPLSMSSRPCIFINTSCPENRVLVLKSKEAMRKLPDSSTNIFQKSILDHYVQRPDSLDVLCLAEFASVFTFSNSKRLKKNIESEEEISETEHFETCEVCLPLKNKSGYITKRNKNKVIRYVRFNIEIDEKNYFREQLMLFTPWRDETKDLLNIDAKQKFLTFKNSIYENQAKFIYHEGSDDWEDIIDRATRVHQEQEEDSDVDSNFEKDSAKQTEFEVLRDRTGEGDIMVDVGSDLGNKSATEFTLPIPHLVREDRYKELVRSLNDKQRRYLIHILHLLKVCDKPIYNCILGGAGVGKSRLIETIQQTVLRHLNKAGGSDLNVIKVLLCAPTGKAAFAIKGVTLHSAFALPLNQFCHEMPPLSSSVTNTLFSQLHQLKLIIMDEVSMIGSKILGQIDKRLRQIFRTNSPFAGKSIILFGDFNQLAPVGDRYIFQPDQSNQYQELIGNPLWDLFKFFKLTEIMRQKDDCVFATALNNLAVGNLSDEEVKLFRQREVTEISKIPNTALRLFKTNAEVSIYNDSVFNKYSNIIIVKALDRVIGNVSDKVKLSLLKTVQDAELHKTYSLPSSLKLVVGVHFMITNNVSVADGLVNGAVGVLKFIEIDTKSEVTRLWMYFNEEQVGKECRAATSNISKQLKLHPLWTPISRVCRNIRPWERTPALVTRRQFPVIPAEAITIHKSQGGTYDAVVIHLRKGLRRNELYVAFSRATRLDGLFLVGKFKSPPPPKADDLVQNTVKEALKNKYIKFSVPFVQDFSGLSIICHNVQSLNLHYLDVVSDETYTSASLIILLETWSKNNEVYNFPYHVEVHRVDVQKSYRHGYGINVFCKENLLDDFEIILQFNSEEKQKSFNLVLLKILDIYVFAGYKPPSTPLHIIVDYLHICLNTVAKTELSKVIIVGDFNVDMMKPIPQMFSNVFSKYKVKNKILNKPSTDGLTQLDICFSNIPNLQASYYESYFSYHKPIVCFFTDHESAPVHQFISSNDEISEPTTSHPSLNYSDIRIGFSVPSVTLEQQPDHPPQSSSARTIQLPPGFTNDDNVSCYANSVCQAFLGSYQIREAILLQKDTNELKNLASWYLNQKILSTKNLRLEVALKANVPQFAQSEQQDVVEFIQHLAIVCPVINNLFGHVINIQYRCTSCQFVSQNLQDNLVLTVSGRNNKFSLSSMLWSDYGCWNRLDATCSSCGSRSTLESRVSVELSDNQTALLIQIGLFELSNSGEVVKNKLLLQNLFSEIIYLSGISFQVSAVLSHHGESTTSGHYTCKLRLDSDICVNADDKTIQQCPLPINITDTYVIMLTKVN